MAFFDGVHSLKGSVTASLPPTRSLTLENRATVNGTSDAGGGILNLGTLTLMNSTVSGNSAPSSSAAGIYVGSLDGLPEGTLTLKSTLLADNGAGGNCFVVGTSTSLGYNLSDDATCESWLTQTTDKNNTAAGLDPKGLQNNGGPTPTIALLPSSPAVDAIPVADCTDANGIPVATDQRGVTRPQGKGLRYWSLRTYPNRSVLDFQCVSAIDTGRHPGLVLSSTFTLGSGQYGVNPATESMTLQIANYTLTLPAGSFHRLWNAANAPYGYEGTVNDARLVLGIVALGNNTFQFDAAGSPVTFTGVKNPVTVTLTCGNDSGTTSVDALITSY